MRRVSVLLLAAGLTILSGCAERYSERMEQTIKDMKYQRALDANLSPPVGEFKDFPLYLRPPKGMAKSADFTLAVLPAGLYDLAASFQSGEPPAVLHVLARQKAKKAAAPKNAPPPAEAAPRGAFEADILTLLTSIFGASDELTAPKWQNETKGKTTFRRLIFNAPQDQVVRVYVYRKEPYDVALIWVVPRDAEKDMNLASARDYCLKSFAVGRRASRAFGGQIDSGEGGGGGGEEGPAF